MATIDDKGLMHRGSIESEVRKTAPESVAKKPPAPESLRCGHGGKKGKR